MQSKTWQLLFQDPEEIVEVTPKDVEAARVNEFQQLVDLGAGRFDVGASSYIRYDLGPEPQVLKDLREEESTEDKKTFDQS
jgi:hypothetical protein